MTNRSGIEEKNRNLLEILHRNTNGPFTPTMAASILSLDLRATRRLLAYLASRGWLARIRHGLYITVPLGATAPSQWREDPWIIAGSIFTPCYIGGWSACEHWGFTEQIFRDVAVVTASPIRERTATIQGTVFRLRFLQEAKHFGTRPIWRGQNKIQVSDPSRTMVDILGAPWMGGGIRHSAEMIKAYFDSEHRDDERLLDYAEKLGNRSVFKRLGFIVETLNFSAPEIIDRCLILKSSGLTSLDPSVPRKGRIVKRWNLRVNIDLKPSQEGL